MRIIFIRNLILKKYADLRLHSDKNGQATCSEVPYQSDKPIFAHYLPILVSTEKKPELIT